MNKKNVVKDCNSCSYNLDLTCILVDMAIMNPEIGCNKWKDKNKVKELS